MYIQLTTMIKLSHNRTVINRNQTVDDAGGI